MNLNIALFIHLSSVWALAGESKLHGTWKSDGNASTAWLLKNANLNEYQKKALPKLFGNATVTFNPDGSGTVVIEANIIPKNSGGEFILKEIKSEFTYKILGESESQIVTEQLTGDQLQLLKGYPFALASRGQSKIGIISGPPKKTYPRK